jgi:hypothetical protein
MHRLISLHQDSIETTFQDLEPYFAEIKLDEKFKKKIKLHEKLILQGNRFFMSLIPTNVSSEQGLSVRVARWYIYFRTKNSNTGIFRRAL